MTHAQICLCKTVILFTTLFLVSQVSSAQTPAITSVSPTSVSVGSQMTIAGSGFGQNQGQGFVILQNVQATIVSWNDTQIVLTVPANTSHGNVYVHTQNGVNSNSMAFNMVAPTITTVSPTSVSIGSQITINGSGFGPTQYNGFVMLQNTQGSVTSWSDTQIVVTVPANTSHGDLYVQPQSGVYSNTMPFTMVAPTITTIAPTSVSIGSQITINGSGFGPAQYNGFVMLQNTQGSVTSWSDTQIVVTVPANTSHGDLYVHPQSGVYSNTMPFTMVASTISSISPNAVSPGMQMAINGSGFGPTQYSGFVILQNLQAPTVSWSDTQIVVTVPTNTAQGSAFVHPQSGVYSNSVPFTIVPPPSLSTISPTTAAVGATVTISGSNLGSGPSGNTVAFNGVTATPTSWTPTSITVPVPSGATTGNVVVTLSGLNSNGVGFTVLPTPNIASLSPNAGAVGTSVTVTGTNFGATQGTSTLSFNGVAATPTSWTSTSIVVPVPSGATTGNVVVNASGASSNGVAFTLANQPPVISTISPNSGGIGTVVTLSGSYFGEMQQSSTATFNGVPATVANWNDTSITVAVPAGLPAGVKNLTVQVAGLASNSISFTVTQPLFITPSQMGMLVGDTLQLQLLDENGVELTDVSWSIDDTSVANITLPQGTGDPTVLQANETGTANILATSGNRTGTAKVTVYDGTVLPVGSIRWAVPPLAGGINNTVQATRVDANTPDFYASDGGTFIRALTSNGRQQWVWPAPGVTRYPWLLAADDQGGAIYFASNDAENQFQSWCYVGRVDENGHEAWQYQETNCLEDYAIGADGTIFLMEDDFQNQGWSQVTALDPKTGNIKFGVPLPADTPSATALNFSYIAGKPDNPPNTYDPYCTPGTTASIYTMPGGSGGPPYNAPMKHGGLTVSSDGKIYLPIATVGDLALDAGGCDPGSDPDYPAPIDRSKATQSVTESLQLLVISPDGSSSIQQVDNQTVTTVNWNTPQLLTPSFRFDNSEASGRAIPDGNGGVFIAGYQSLYHGNSSGFAYSTVPIIISQCFGRDYTCDPLLLGEDGTVYLNGYSSPRGPIDTATAVDPISGSTKWTWQSTGVNLNTVMANGTVAVQSQNSLQLIDPSGQATPALSTTLVGDDATYYTNGFWSSALPDGSLGLIAGGDPLYVASTERPQKKGGGAKKNRPTPPEIVDYLPSFIESSTGDNLTTGTFPAKMDKTVFNGLSPSAQAMGNPVFQQYNLRAAATVQKFRDDVSRPLDVLAFLGHSSVKTVDVGKGPQSYSIGINFYYPLYPGTNPGDVSSWDIPYYCQPVGACTPIEQDLNRECSPGTLPENCDGSVGKKPVNKLVPLEKKASTVTGLTDPIWQFGNDLVTTSKTPGPDHAPILLADKLAVNAKVIFAGACSLLPAGNLITKGEVPVFLQMWDIHDAQYDYAETRDRAIIVPKAGTEALLEDSAQQWMIILNDMVNNKKTVQEAVDDANAKDTNNNLFTVYGNHSVRISTATEAQ